VVEDEVSLVERLVRPNKLDRAAAVLPVKRHPLIGFLGGRRRRPFLRGHRRFLSILWNSWATMWTHMFIGRGLPGTAVGMRRSPNRGSRPCCLRRSCRCAGTPFCEPADDRVKNGREEDAKNSHPEHA